MYCYCVVMKCLGMNVHSDWVLFCRYDNEFGYSNRVCDLMAYMASKE